jgi:hypothetical protein
MIKNAGYFSEADIIRMRPVVSVRKKEEYDIILTWLLLTKKKKKGKYHTRL